MIEDPQKVYQNKAFKIHAVKMYAPWVAMEAVCDEYTEKIKASREDRYLCENPTIEEAHQRVPLLCKEFERCIEEEDAKIVKQIEEDQAIKHS